MTRRASWMSLLARRLAACIAAVLLWLPPGAQASEVLMVAEDSPAIRSFVDALTARRQVDSVRFMALDQAPSAAQLPSDLRLITLGKPALAWRLQSRQGPPTLALLISRVQAHAVLKGAPHPRVSLLWSDPPIERQLRLIRLILPSAERVGLPYDQDSGFLVAEAVAAGRALGLTVVPHQWQAPWDTESLTQLLRSTDALLGLDDRNLYNPRTAKTLLLTSYGQHRALFGPSAAFVRAGSLATTYSDQHDWLAVLDELLQQPPASWPARHYPERFKVLGNRQVARSLGIRLPEDEQLAAQLAKEKRR